MQSIFTKYISATNTRGSRVKAWASGWADNRKPLSLSLPWDNSLNTEHNHRKAAYTLAAKLNWHGHWYEGGNDKGRGNVYVLAIERDSFIVDATPQQGESK